MRRRSCGHLYDIVESAQAIRDGARNRTFQDYIDDLFFRRGTERLFQIIGEAMHRLAHDDPETAGHFENYQQIISFRNVLIHRYSEIDDHIVWRTATVDLPLLLERARALLSECEEI